MRPGLIHALEKRLRGPDAFTLEVETRDGVVHDVALVEVMSDCLLVEGPLPSGGRDQRFFIMLESINTLAIMD